MAASVAPTTDSFMYQTMHRQPADLRHLLETGWSSAEAAADLIGGCRRVWVTGVGTSYHASLMGAWLFRTAGLDARAVLSADLALYPDSFAIDGSDAVVIMAHTGVKSVSAVALERAVAAGATVISVGSTTAEHPGSRLVLRTIERERSAAYTSSHLAAQCVLAQVATVLLERGGNGGLFRAGLERIPDLVDDVLRRQDEVLPISASAIKRRIYVAGAGPSEVAAIEAVIKVREAAYGWIDALALEQFLHGPAVAVNAGDLAVLVNPPGAAVERTGEIAAMLGAIGAELWLVGEGAARVPDAAVFAISGLAKLPEVLTPLVTVVPLQILAYQLAAAQGINPDTFRRDNPVYKEAIGLLKL
jgi:glucosamine--fructose-6-phosphate aminotransferase (isomerizing)